MNIEARKIQFVQEFLKLNNEEIVSHLEKFLKIEVSTSLKPFTSIELNARIDKSESDFNEGKTISNIDVKAKYL